MTRPRDERHRYGQHYTPVGVAGLLAAFAVRSPSDVVLDPSCGDGRLLSEALMVKRGMAARSSGVKGAQAFGLDRSRSAVEVAARTGAQVERADFFDVEPGARLNAAIQLPARFDAIIGNPPYIRQEFMGAGDKRRIEARLALDRAAQPAIVWPRWSGRSDIYVYFFAHAAAFLRDGGRLVFLTASSWLDVGYGEALREFLLNNFRIIAIIESAAESFFGDASINTAITVLERESDEEARAAARVRFVRLDKPLDQIFGGLVSTNRVDARCAFARSVESTPSSLRTGQYRIRVVEQAACRGGWGKYLRADDVFFQILERGGSKMRRLSDIARLRFGVKTGANEFFYLMKGEQSEGALQPLANLAAVRRGLTTGANAFFYLTRQPAGGPFSIPQSLIPVLDASGETRMIESRFLTPIIFSLKEIAGIALDAVQSKKLFFHCSASREQLEGTRALHYIRSGERAGYNKRPTCAARDPWYSVANGRKPAPLIFPSKVGERWLVALNRAGAFEDKKLYGIFPSDGTSEFLLAALLNSTWARYYAEVTCRQMTGAQAIADIDVAVAEQILIPDPRALSRSLRKKLETALKSLIRRPVWSVFEEVKRDDRRGLDLLVLEAIGFRQTAERVRILERLYKATSDLVRARLAKRCDPGPGEGRAGFKVVDNPVGRT